MNGLEALDYISKFTNFQGGAYKDKLKVIEKELKVLNMVRRNRIVIYDKQTFAKHINTYCEDIIAFHIPHGKDEFDLLKEVLK